jgi:uncharacterized protein Veg
VSYARIVQLVAETEEDKIAWLNAIRDAIALHEGESVLLKKNPIGWKRSGKIK